MRKIFTLCLILTAFLSAHAQRDLKIVRAIPDTLSCGVGSPKPVTVLIKNTGTATINDAVANYSLTGVAGNIQQNLPPLNPGDSTLFTFTQGLTVANSAAITITVFLNVPSSSNLIDDTIRYDRNYSSIITSSFPSFIDFDRTSLDGFYKINKGAGQNDFTIGRAPQGNFIRNTGSGTGAFFMTSGSTSPNYANNSLTYFYTRCYNFTGVTSPRIAFNLAFNTEGAVDGLQLQASTNGGATWRTVGTPTGTWYNTNTISSFNQLVKPGLITANGWSGNSTAGAGRYVYATVTAANLANKPNVSFRFVFASNAYNNDGDGFAIDNFRVFDTELPNLQFLNFSSLTTSNCNANAATPVTIKVKNTGAITSGIVVNYRFNNGPIITENITQPLAKNDTLVYTFLQPINTLLGPDTIRAWVSSPYDITYGNDTSTRYIFNQRQSVNQFPYVQNFESGNGGWTTASITSVNSTWALGNPNKTTIRNAASGTKAWVTGGLGTGKYLPNERSFILGPCFDFSSLTDPIFSAKIWWDTEADNDAVQLQYSTNLGTSWNNVGRFSPGIDTRQNWYNSISSTISSTNTGSIKDSWTGTAAEGSGRYLLATQSLRGAAGLSNVQIRIVFAANATLQYDGFAIDDISIYNRSGEDLALRSITGFPIDCNSTATFRPVLSIQNMGNSNYSDTTIIRMRVQGPNGLDTTITDTNFTLAINTGTSNNYTFPDTLLVNAVGAYKVNFSLSNNDADLNNDTLSTVFYRQTGVNTYPYFESFESGNANWAPVNFADTFRLGTPNKASVNMAYNGTKAWVTGSLSNNYKKGSKLQLVSPCFDFTSLPNPYVEFYCFWDSPTSDGASLQSSTDGGTTWTTIGSVVNNWFTQAGVSSLSASYTGATANGWSGTNSSSSLGWRRVARDISALGGQANVRLRFIFASDLSGNGPGFGFDHFTLKSKPTTDPALTALIVPKSGCAGRVSDSVKVTINNASTALLDSTTGVILYVNGVNYDTVYINRTLATTRNQTLKFKRTINTAAIGQINIKVAVLSTRDDDTTNSYINSQINTSNIVSTFPYGRTFETNNAGFFTNAFKGTQIWRRIKPNFVYNRSNFDSTAFVATNTNQNYGPNAASVLETNCFDLRNLVKPYVEFDAAWIMDSRTDGVSFQYTTNGGTNWVTMTRSAKDTRNWYAANSVNTNTFGVTAGWTGRSKTIDNRNLDTTAYINIHNLLDTTINWSNVASVKFRFVMWSDNISTITNRGFALNNFTVKSAPTKDVEAIAFLGPIESCDLGSPKIGLVIRNNNDTLNSRNYQATISVNGTSLGTVTRLNNDTLPTLGTDTLYLPARPNFSADGSYFLTGAFRMAGDEHAYNDTFRVEFQNYPVNQVPYKQGWRNNTDSNWVPHVIRGSANFVLGYPTKISVIGGYKDSIAWSVGNLAGSIPNNSAMDLQSPCFDLSTMAAVNGGYLSFRMALNTQLGTDGVQLQYQIGAGSWQTLLARPSGRTTNWYTDPVASFTSLPNGNTPQINFGWSGTTNGYELYQTELPQALITNNVRFRFLFACDAATTSSGVLIDDFRLTPKPRVDLYAIGVEGIDDFCGVSGIQRVGIKTYNLTPFASPQYRAVLFVNNLRYDSLTNLLSIPAYDTAKILFRRAIDFSQLRDYNIKIIVFHPDDEFHDNDTLIQKIWSTRPITSLPFAANFDTATNGFVPVQFDNVSNTRFEWGLASLKPTFGTAHSGTKAWMTNATANYTLGSNCALVTPCISLASASKLKLSFWLKYSSEQGLDGMTLESSDDNGASWKQVGTQALANWYNTPIIVGFSPNRQGWSGTANTTWAKYTLSYCPSSNNVRFRFRFASDPATNDWGFGIDDFRLDLEKPYDVGIVKITRPTTDGCGVSATTYPVIRVVNAGSSQAVNIPVTATLVGRGQVFNDIIPGPIAPCDTIDFQLSASSFDMNPIGTYTLRVALSLPGDSNATNNTVTTTTIRYSDTIRRTIFNGFTGTNLNTILPGWSNRTGDLVPDLTSSGTGWVQSTTAQNSVFRKTGARVNIPDGIATIREWLITNPINVFPSSEIVFSAAKFKNLTPPFYQPNVAILDFDDSLEVVVSPDCGDNWYRVLQLGEDDLADTLRTFRAQIGKFGTTNIRVAFYVTNGTNWSATCNAPPGCTNKLNTDIFLTNVRYDPGPEHDLTVLRFETPYKTCGLNASDTLQVRIKNRGYRNEANFPVSVRIDNNPPFSINVTDTIRVLEEKIVTISTNEYFGADRAYRAVATVSLSNDSVPSNNTLTTTFNRYSVPTNIITFTELNGNASNLPIVYNGWEYATGDLAQGPAGSGWNKAPLRTAALSRRLSNEDKISWLISPELHLTRNSSLSYDAALFGAIPSFGSSQYVEIRASADCGRSWPIIVSLIDNEAISDVATTYGVDLTPYAGRALRFAFRFVDGPTAGAPRTVSMLLDNIIFNADQSQDAAVSAIVFSRQDSCLRRNQILPFSVKVSNAGSDLINEVPISIDVRRYDGSLIQNFTATTGSIDVGGFEEVLMGSIQVDSTGPLGFSASVNLTNDRFASNNSLFTAKYFCNTIYNGTEALQTTEVRIYPNPNDGKFQINFGNQLVKNVNVIVMNPLGQTITTASSPEIAPNTSLPINLNNVAKGMYIVKIATSNGDIFRNVVVK